MPSSQIPSSLPSPAGLLPFISTWSHSIRRTRQLISLSALRPNERGPSLSSSARLLQPEPRSRASADLSVNRQARHSSLPVGHNDLQLPSSTEPLIPRSCPFSRSVESPAHRPPRSALSRARASLRRPPGRDRLVNSHHMAVVAHVPEARSLEGHSPRSARRSWPSSLGPLEQATCRRRLRRRAAVERADEVVREAGGGRLHQPRRRLRRAGEGQRAERMRCVLSSST